MIYHSKYQASMQEMKQLRNLPAQNHSHSRAFWEPNRHHELCRRPSLHHNCLRKPRKQPISKILENPWASFREFYQQSPFCCCLVFHCITIPNQSLERRQRILLGFLDLWGFGICVTAVSVIHMLPYLLAVIIQQASSQKSLFLQKIRFGVCN